MRARVKETGEIIEVQDCSADMYVEKFGELTGRLFHITELDFDNLESPDYWTRLEHQAAIAAMQGILSNHNIYSSVIHTTQVSRVAIDYAQELVEKMKEERK